jgi:hypothetical protein
MTKRKSFGNPLSRTFGKAIDKVAPEVLDGFMDAVSGPKKTPTKSSSSAARSTDWATRAPASPRKRH